MVCGTSQFTFTVRSASTLLCASVMKKRMGGDVIFANVPPVAPPEATGSPGDELPQRRVMESKPGALHDNRLLAVAGSLQNVTGEGSAIRVAGPLVATACTVTLLRTVSFAGSDASIR